MSTKTVAAKLLVKPDTTLWSSHVGRLALIGPLPAGVTVAGAPELATTALFFVDSEADLRELLATHGQRLAEPANLWFLYPKSGKADLNRDTLWPIVAVHGVRPITQVAVDETWSALRFRPLKEGEAPFNPGREK